MRGSRSNSWVAGWNPPTLSHPFARRLVLPGGRVSCSVLFAGVFAAGMANGASEKVARTIFEQGPWMATLDTFDISVVVWGACLAGLALLLKAPPRPASRADYIALAMAAAAITLPVPPLSWLAVSGLALYLYFGSEPHSQTRRAAAILFAVTIPELWARLVFAALTNWVLQLDAWLVALFLGTAPRGNLVPFADGAGIIVIAPGCSSMSNISLALLCTAAFANFYDRPFSAGLLLQGLAAVLAVVVINVVRIGMIGIDPAHYELIHGTTGATIAGWLTAAAIVALSSMGMGLHEAGKR